MAYSTWADNPIYASVTPCQVDIMMNNILQQKCDYAADVTGTECAPPQSFVAGNYQIIQEKSECQQCLYLGASSNEHMYKVEIYGKEGPAGANLITETGWLDGPAGFYCYSVSETSPLLTGEHYIIRLYTENNCGDQHVYTTEFTARNDCAHQYGGGTVVVSPDPAVGNNGHFTVTVPNGGNARMIYYDPFSGAYDVIWSAQQLPPNYQATHTVSIAQWTTGIKYIFLETEQGVSNTKMIRQ